VGGCGGGLRGARRRRRRRRRRRFDLNKKPEPFTDSGLEMF
jgi:hypothetical protein